MESRLHVHTLHAYLTFLCEDNILYIHHFERYIFDILGLYYKRYAEFDYVVFIFNKQLFIKLSDSSVTKVYWFSVSSCFPYHSKPIKDCVVSLFDDCSTSRTCRSRSTLSTAKITGFSLENWLIFFTQEPEGLPWYKYAVKEKHSSFCCDSWPVVDGVVFAGEARKWRVSRQQDTIR